MAMFFFIKPDYRLIRMAAPSSINPDWWEWKNSFTLLLGCQLFQLNAHSRGLAKTDKLYIS
jgi:hypothetical protein